nr:MAG: coat protein [Chemarfal virus 157]
MTKRKRSPRKKGSAAPKKPQQKAKTAKNKAATPIPRSLVSLVCGLNDPFCDHTMTARYLDTGRTRTIAFPWRGGISYASDANGNQSWLFLPNFANRWYMTPLSITTGTATFTGNGTPGNLMSNVQSYRITSAGMKLTCLSNRMTTSGMLRVRSFAVPDGSSLVTVQTATKNCIESMDVAIEPGAEYTIAFKRLDSRANLLVSPATTWAVSSAYTSWVAPGWSALLLSVDGAPVSTTMFDIQFYQNYEIVLADDDNTQQLAQPSPPAVPQIVDAINLVSSDTKAFVKGGVAQFGKMVVNSAIKALTTTAVGLFTKSPTLALTAGQSIPELD